MIELLTLNRHPIINMQDFQELIRSYIFSKIISECFFVVFRK